MNPPTNWAERLLAKTENVPSETDDLSGRRFVLCERMPDGSLRVPKRGATRDNPPTIPKDGRTGRACSWVPK